ncbi:hypothetical protein BU26DRAFT_557121 [Trematosphaeria pertusa]|uniref:Uncharacterized protein n=1 Tax=Trematosphaeria pertusa TaxID=390896 RepID=A0A6A6IZD3_9PLEO|nr:uncharacterized protein BU26DRAFT_557121 [Trematosphaeria pertusa]KAF2255608.1 hypothetical protein BU26DRAFT_557121 [Trematosphaeria pertusa]
MLDIHRDSGPATKFFFSHSLLPSYLDPQNVSTKKKPFSTFNAQPFSHTLDLILPEEIYELVRAQLEKQDGVARGMYARVYMKLGEILEREFLEEYVKKGNIMMLSEGRPLVDNVFALHDGVLRLELDRPTYERCGLQGKPIEDGGKKHQKARWVVEFGLRAPSMVHGKKGFSRLEWACKNVLNESLTWLFYNFNPSAREALPAGKEPISTHQPFIHALEPTVTKLPRTLVPNLAVADLSALYAQEDALTLYEYLALLSLGSPRLCATDRVDPHLSRYEVPDFGHGLGARDMVRVRWRGFIPAQFVRDLFLVVRREGLKVVKAEQDGEGGTQRGEEDRWVCWSAGAFGGKKGWTVMQWAGRETLVWECEG